jgi:hypothetical protein
MLIGVIVAGLALILGAIEDHLQYAWRYRNRVDRQPNARIEHFSGLNVACLAGFRRGEFLEPR